VESIFRFTNPNNTYWVRLVGAYVLSGVSAVSFYAAAHYGLRYATARALCAEEHLLNSIEDASDIKIRFENGGVVVERPKTSDLYTRAVEYAGVTVPKTDFHIGLVNIMIAGVSGLSALVVLSKGNSESRNL
jgi:hypothetical protein